MSKEKAKKDEGLLQLDVHVFVSMKSGEDDTVKIKVWRGFQIPTLSAGKQLAAQLIHGYVEDEDNVRFEPIRIVRYWPWDHTSNEPPRESETVHTF